MKTTVGLSFAMEVRNCKMTTGLYYYNGKIFYGKYDEQQVSGRISCKAIKADCIMTNQEFSRDDFAVTFFDNHSLLEAETPDLLACLNVAMMLDGRDVNEGDNVIPKDKQLPVNVPAEFVRIYEMIGDNDSFFSAEEHFVRPDELSVDTHVIAFFAKADKPLAGLDVQSGRLTRYGKDGWTIENGDVSFFRFCIEHILLNILDRRAVIKNGRLKGPLVSSLNIERALERNGTGSFQILKEMGIYGVAVLYDDAGTIARIRSNGFYGDVLIGAKESQGMDSILDVFKGNLNLAP